MTVAMFVISVLVSLFFVFGSNYIWYKIGVSHGKKQNVPLKLHPQEDDFEEQIFSKDAFYVSESVSIHNH